MIVTIQAQAKLELKGKEFTAFDADLKKKYPNLIGWSYRHEDGELTLDFGEAIEEQAKTQTEAVLSSVKEPIIKVDSSLIKGEAIENARIATTIESKNL